MISILLIAIVGAAFHYLSYHALITQWIWSRYPRPVDSFLSCAACSGTWIGLGLATPLMDEGYPLLGQTAGASYWILAAAVGMVTTPVVAAIQLVAMRSIGGGPPIIAENGDGGEE